MALITGFDMFTRKVLSTTTLINGSDQTVSALGHTYTYGASHKLHIFGGITCYGVSAADFNSHFYIIVDGTEVFSPDQHFTPGEWWHQGFSFMTGTLSSSQHVCHLTGTNQDGNFSLVGNSNGNLTQICYQIVTL